MMFLLILQTYYEHQANSSDHLQMAYADDILYLAILATSPPARKCMCCAGQPDSSLTLATPRMIPTNRECGEEAEDPIFLISVGTALMGVVGLPSSSRGTEPKLLTDTPFHDSPALLLCYLKQPPKLVSGLSFVGRPKPAQGQSQGKHCLLCFSVSIKFPKASSFVSPVKCEFHRDESCKEENTFDMSMNCQC